MLVSRGRSRKRKEKRTPAISSARGSVVKRQSSIPRRAVEDRSSSGGSSTPRSAVKDLASPIADVSSTRDPRLPPAGTVLVKRDRSGCARCECTIEEAGVRYNGTLYPSLSASASAAAKDLGLKASVNGFVFWEVIGPSRSSVSPCARLRRIGERYEERAREYLAVDGAEIAALHEELTKHAMLIRRLLDHHAAATAGCVPTAHS